ncbi:MAG TPA: hypothetical protein VMT30_04315 [Candidatus Saccharimonadia bacterium]|nr:hypothetical protein [Candidatus Saccharimonadia bacterium]
MKLFFSWQSDSPGNRNLLEQALKDVGKDIPDFEIDTATRLAVGSRDIGAMILEKIDGADFMLADVTILDPDAVRPTPNPNVIYEAGYAMKALGEGRVIFVADRRSTTTANLPFDIRNRLMILADFSKPEAARKEVAAVIKTVTANYTPADPNAGAPKITLVKDTEARWASNYSDYGAAFEVKFIIDNDGGGLTYVTNAQLVGTNGDGSPFVTDSFRFADDEIDHPYGVMEGAMEQVTLFLGADRSHHRQMPDLDRDTVELVVTFRGGRIVRVPVRIVQS